MTAGAPTKYNAKMLDKVQKIFDEWEPYYECPVDKQDKSGNVTSKMERIPNPPPTKGAIAKAIGITRCTIWRWEEKHKELCDVIKKGTKECFREGFWTCGLTGSYNSAVAIFGAKNKLDMTDKTEHLGNPDKPLIQTIERVIIKSEDKVKN